MAHYDKYLAQLDAGETVTLPNRAQAAAFQNILRAGGYTVDESTAKTGLSFVITKFGVIETI